MSQVNKYEKQLFEGVAHGGPYDGLTLESRFPKGILFVDKPTETAIVYDWAGYEEGFRARTERPVALDHTGRLRAADEPNYDVRARIEEVGNW
jgi:hypothetical protein